MQTNNLLFNDLQDINFQSSIDLLFNDDLQNINTQTDDNLQINDNLQNNIHNLLFDDLHDNLLLSNIDNNLQINDNSQITQINNLSMFDVQTNIDDLLDKYKIQDDVFIGYNKYYGLNEVYNYDNDYKNIFQYYEQYINNELNKDLKKMFINLKKIINKKKYKDSNEKYYKVDTYLLAYALKIFLENKLKLTEQIINENDINSIEIKPKIQVLLRRIKRFEKIKLPLNGIYIEYSKKLKDRKYRLNNKNNKIINYNYCKSKNIGCWYCKPNKQCKCSKYRKN